MSTTEGGSEQLDEVVLSGGGARLPELRDAVAERLQTEVTVLDPLRAVEIESEHRQAIVDHGGPEVAAVLVGLVLRGKE